MIIGLIFLFQCSDFNQVYENGGKDYLEKEYKDFKWTKNIKIYNENFDLGIEINLENFNNFYNKSIFKKLSEEEKKDIEKNVQIFAKNIAEKFSSFRIGLYSFVINKFIENAKQKKIVKPLTLKLNNTNILHMINSDNSIKLIYGINNKDSYNQSLCDLFLKEFSKEKNNEKKFFNVEIYSKSNIFLIDGVNDEPSKYSNGFAVFNLYSGSIDNLKNYSTFFVTFIQYIQKFIFFARVLMHKMASDKGKPFKDKYRILPNKYIEDPQIKDEISTWFRNQIATDLKSI